MSTPTRTVDVLLDGLHFEDEWPARIAEFLLDFL